MIVMLMYCNLEEKVSDYRRWESNRVSLSWKLSFAVTLKLSLRGIGEA